MTATDTHRTIDAIWRIESARLIAGVARLVRDRSMSAGEAHARIAAQATDEQRRAVADVMIDNDGTFAELAARVDEVWQDVLLPRVAAAR